jgi:hypothetical protein
MWNGLVRFDTMVRYFIKHRLFVGNKERANRVNALLWLKTILVAVAASSPHHLLSASAQMAGGNEKALVPVFSQVDHNGVNLGELTLSIPEPSVSIGDPANGGLAYRASRQVSAYPEPDDVGSTWSGTNLLGFARWEPICDAVLFGDACVGLSILTVQVGGHADKFVNAAGGPQNMLPVFSSGGYFNTSTDEYIAADGTKYTFGQPGAESLGDVSLYVTRADKPDGEVVTWHYAKKTIPSIVSPFYDEVPRLQSVTNNLGYQIHFEYVSNVTTHADWAKLKRVTEPPRICRRLLFLRKWSHEQEAYSEVLA